MAKFMAAHPSTGAQAAWLPNSTTRTVSLQMLWPRYRPSCEHLSALRHANHLVFPNAGSDHGHGRRYAPSLSSQASVPSMSPFADPGLASPEPYPAWSSDRQIPMSTEEIEDIFFDLAQKFGFQRDSMRNMVSSSSAILHMLLMSSSV